MTHEPPQNDDLREAVRRREGREAEWHATGERSVWQNLSMIGALGWMIVVPALLGGLLGRWIDRLTGQPIFWSATCIVLGIALGSWMAWKRARGEGEGQ